jgi:alanyl-tRNA synthetase
MLLSKIMFIHSHYKKLKPTHMTLFEQTRNNVANAYIQMLEQGIDIEETTKTEIQTNFNECSSLMDLFSLLDEYGFGEYHAKLFVSDTMANKAF